MDVVVVVVVDVVVDVVDSVMITLPGPFGTRGELSQPVDRTARQRPLRSNLRILQTQIDADHGRDGRVKTAVLERNHRVQRQKKLAFQIHFQAWYQQELLNALRQSDEGFYRRDPLTTARRRVCYVADLPAALNVPSEEIHEQRKLRRRFQLDAGGVLNLMPDFDGVILRKTGRDLYTVAPPFVAGIGVRPESPRAARYDKRRERAVNAQTAQRLRSPVGNRMFMATAIPPGSGKPVPNLAKRYLARAATSPSPPNVPEPSAPRTSVPLPFTNDEVPSNLMLTIGMATPTSRFSVMPTVLETTSILYDNPRLAVPVRAAPGDAALTLPIFKLLRERSSSFLYVAALKLAPMLTCPSPEVNARSANEGPNVVAVRASRPVEGSSLKTKPPLDVPKGVVAISSAVASPIASAAGREPSGPTNSPSVPASVNPSTSVIFCADAGVQKASVSAAIATVTCTRRLVVIHSDPSEALSPAPQNGTRDACSFLRAHYRLRKWCKSSLSCPRFSHDRGQTAGLALDIRASSRRGASQVLAGKTVPGSDPERCTRSSNADTRRRCNAWPENSGMRDSWQSQTFVRR